KMRVRVQIGRERYRELCAYVLSIACHRSTEDLARELWNVPFEPYAPVRRQLLNLLRLINTKRQSAGHSKVPRTVLRYRREIVRPFQETSTFGEQGTPSANGEDWPAPNLTESR